MVVRGKQSAARLRGTLTIEVDAMDTVADFKGRHGVERVEQQKGVSTGGSWMDA